MFETKNPNNTDFKQSILKFCAFSVISLVSTASIWCILSNVPIFFVKWGRDLGFGQETGTIGDTLGGTLGPFIAAIAAILTFFAFYIQYEANQLQRIDLAKERFENRFYELLKLHKDNVSEMKIGATDIVTAKTTVYDYQSGPKDETSETKISIEINGRDVFQNMYKEFLSCYRICKEALHFSEEIRDNHKYIIEVSYKIFFNGLNSPLINKINEEIVDDEEHVKKCKQHLRKAGEIVQNSPGKPAMYMPPDRSFAAPVILYTKYHPFMGHSSRLGYYYRHLFLMVKYIVNQSEELLPYEDKREYLRILRAQLSGDEQLMLYFNYLGGIGNKWENEKNQFFSKYRMIHNLPLELAETIFDPRKEFSKQIDEIRNSGQEMFEYDE